MTVSYHIRFINEHTFRPHMLAKSCNDFISCDREINIKFFSMLTAKPLRDSEEQFAEFEFSSNQIPTRVSFLNETLMLFVPYMPFSSLFPPAQQVGQWKVSRSPETAPFSPAANPRFTNISFKRVQSFSLLYFNHPAKQTSIH